MSVKRPDWDELARQAAAVIDEEEPLRLDFPSGRLFVDHAGVALLVHRCAAPPSGPPKADPYAACAAAHRLVTSQPAYLLATGGPEEHDGIRQLAQAAARALAGRAGSALVVEVWSPLDDDDDDDDDPFHRQPGFTLYVPDDPRAVPIADVLEEGLSEIELAGQGAEVTRVEVDSFTPPGLPRLFDDDGEFVVLGLAVDAVFLNTREEEFYPGVLDELRRSLAPALGQAATAFAREVGAPEVTIGRRHLEPAAEVVDRGMAAIERRYELLLQVTPINSDEAWDDFQASRFEIPPELLYRPFTFDPDRLLRELFALPVDAVEDPTVAELLREKRDEVSVEVQMILDRETSHFLPASLRLYGAPDAALVALAGDVLDHLADQYHDTPAVELVGATAFAAQADREIAYYRERFDGFAGGVEVRKDIPGTLMVSRGRLLIGHTIHVRADRVPALIAHEVGTHVLTYYNACAQPLRQLRYGLADYEPLQEGLAVLGEWLVGGLSHRRMRTLAARVLAVTALVDGADFVETFRLLVDRAGLTHRNAFLVTLRVHRGGGLTKDMIYLKGLRDLLAHLERGGDFWRLFIGKIAQTHLPAVRELLERGILEQPPLKPHYVSDPTAMARLEHARQGITVLDLL